MVASNGSTCQRKLPELGLVAPSCRPTDAPARPPVPETVVPSSSLPDAVPEQLGSSLLRTSTFSTPVASVPSPLGMLAVSVVLPEPLPVTFTVKRGVRRSAVCFSGESMTLSSALENVTSVGTQMSGTTTTSTSRSSSGASTSLSGSKRREKKTGSGGCRQTSPGPGFG